MTKIPIPAMNVVTVSKESTTDKNRQSKGGHRPTLYEARSPGARITPYRGINKLRNRLKLIDTGIPAVNIIPPNQESLPTVATSYGHVPVGSILSNQCCMMPFLQLYQWHFMD